MIPTPQPLGVPDSPLDVYLLGTVDLTDCLTLQQELVQAARDAASTAMTVLICEHPGVITMGRRGSRQHVEFSPQELASQLLEIHWLNRGGGAMLHLVGQLAFYVVAPLDQLGWTPGGHVRRLQTGIAATMAEIGVPGFEKSGRHGIWGRTGQMAAIGVAIKHGIAYFGGVLNVSNGMHLFRRVQTDPDSGTQMSSLVVESQKPVKMATVRAALVRQLAAALGCEKYHLHTGHPRLVPLRPARGK